MRDFKKAVFKLKKKEKRLGKHEVGCINCVRSRQSNSCCDRCIAFSEFKNVEMLNKELKEKGLDYLCVSNIEELTRNGG